MGLLLNHNSTGFQFPTTYEAKKSKNVYHISSVTICREARGGKLPEIIQRYNESRVGVHVVDQMVRYHTSKVGARGWSVAVWYSILDLACIKAYILHKEATNASRSRRQFLRQVSSVTHKLMSWRTVNAFWKNMSAVFNTHRPFRELSLNFTRSSYKSISSLMSYSWRPRFEIHFPRWSLKVTKSFFQREVQGMSFYFRQNAAEAKV